MFIVSKDNMSYVNLNHLRKIEVVQLIKNTWDVYAAFNNEDDDMLIGRGNTEEEGQKIAKMFMAEYHQAEKNNKTVLRWFDEQKDE